MVVGLTAEQEAACRDAIAPVEIVRGGDVREACASMSTVLPLVVVVDDDISEADHADLAEFATACGAELVTVPRTVTGKGFGARLFEALRIAERRRLGVHG
ncbi:MAG TPA: hypothetical protein VM925_36210 [Labilithrix sp.]|nr:hypothetical protein [Labilithrix sp.]